MDKRIRKIYLENNHCSDEMFSRILEGLRSVNSLKSIIYILNEFGAKSTEKLIAILKKTGSRYAVAFENVSARLRNFALRTARSERTLLTRCLNSYSRSAHYRNWPWCVLSLTRYHSHC